MHTIAKRPRFRAFATTRLARHARRATDRMILTTFGVAASIALALGGLDTSTQLAVDYFGVVRLAAIMVASIMIVAQQTADHRAMISRVEGTVARVESAVHEVGRDLRADAEMAVSRVLVAGLHAMAQARTDLEALHRQFAALPGEMAGLGTQLRGMYDQTRRGHVGMHAELAEVRAEMLATRDQVATIAAVQHQILAHLRELTGERADEMAAVARRSLGGVLAIHKRLDNLEAAPADEKALADAHWRGYAACIEDQQAGRVVPIRH